MHIHMCKQTNTHKDKHTQTQILSMMLMVGEYGGPESQKKSSSAADQNTHSNTKTQLPHFL